MWCGAKSIRVAQLVINKRDRTVNQKQDGNRLSKHVYIHIGVEATSIVERTPCNLIIISAP